MNKAAKLIIVDTSEKYLLLKRDNHPLFGDDPDLPGGTLEGDESPIDTMAREVYEEAGITIDTNTVQLLYEGTEFSKRGDQFSLYITTVAEQPAVTLSWEHVSFAWLSREEFLCECKVANDTYMHMVYAVLSAQPVAR